MRFIILLFISIVISVSNARSSDELEIREKRTIFGPPTSHPSKLSVTYQTAKTEVFSSIIRWFLHMERKWYDIMSEYSSTEVTAVIVVGVVATFLIVFFVLLVVIGKPLALLPLATVKKRRNVIDDEPHLEFSLPEWMDRMEDWVKTNKPSEKRYRCCFYPTAEPEGYARCFPLLAKFIYPWNNPCSREHGYRDVKIDQDYRLH